MAEYVAELEADVWKCLQRVTDPELDEPITSMGFVESVEVLKRCKAVEVEFRLPTYWCSPNFAYMMASDIRSEIENLEWVKRATVHLNDHCFADRINDGVNGDCDFDTVFSEYSNGEDLNAMRVKFLEKAFLRRQETILLALVKQGFSRVAIVSMSVAELDAVEFVESEDRRQKGRYLELLVSRRLAKNATDCVFPTWEGKDIEASDFKSYLSQCRAVRINMEFNSALCRGLKESRYQELRVDPDRAMPIKFVRNAGKAEPNNASS